MLNNRNAARQWTAVVLMWLHRTPPPPAFPEWFAPPLQVWLRLPHHYLAGGSPSAPITYPSVSFSPPLITTPKWMKAVTDSETERISPGRLLLVRVRLKGNRFPIPGHDQPAGVRLPSPWQPSDAEERALLLGKAKASGGDRTKTVIQRMASFDWHYLRRASFGVRVCAIAPALANDRSSWSAG